MSTSTCERVVENVWDYPRPAILEPIDDEVRIVFNGVEVVKTTNAMRVLETSHPPTYYVPMSEISGSVQLSQVAGGGSYCEWKGRAQCTMISLHTGKRLHEPPGHTHSRPPKLTQTRTMVGQTLAKVQLKASEAPLGHSRTWLRSTRHESTSATLLASEPRPKMADSTEDGSIHGFLEANEASRGLRELLLLKPCAYLLIIAASSCFQ